MLLSDQEYITAAGIHISMPVSGVVRVTFLKDKSLKIVGRVVEKRSEQDREKLGAAASLMRLFLKQGSK